MYESSTVLHKISNKIIADYDRIFFHGAVFEYKSKEYPKNASGKLKALEILERISSVDLFAI